MMRMTTLVAIITLAATATGGDYNKRIDIGQPAPTWSNLPGVDGNNHSLADLKDKAVVVVIFTCNSCPVAVGYEDRIVAFAKKHDGADSKVAVVAINVNTIEADRLDKMKERAKEKGFTFAYLYDESQRIAREFGAQYTPEFFVLDKERKVAYMGAMDDKSPPADASKSYLDEAVAAVLKGEKAPLGETLARGCRVRFDRTKR